MISSDLQLIYIYLLGTIVMASPGQRRGTCGHVMMAFDLHKKCARCRDKKLGDDPCVRDKDCSVCDNLTDGQKSMLSTPQYLIRKDKKSGVLVFPHKVTIVGPVETSEADDNAHAQLQPGSGPSSVPSYQQFSGGFVSRQDFDVLNNQLEEKFARFEALLSRSNIFSTPKLPVQIDNPPVSDTPFINPSPEPRATGSVRIPGQDTEVGLKKKDKGVGKSKKRKSKPTAAAGSADQLATSAQDLPIKKDVPGPGLNLLIICRSQTQILILSPVFHLPVHLTNRFSPVPVLLVSPVRLSILIASLTRTPSCRTLMWILLMTNLTEIPVKRASCLILK